MVYPYSLIGHRHTKTSSDSSKVKTRCETSKKLYNKTLFEMKEERPRSCLCLGVAGETLLALLVLVMGHHSFWLMCNT